MELIINIAIVLAVICMSVFLFTSFVIPVCLFIAIYIGNKWEKRSRRKLFEKKMKSIGLPKKCWHCENRRMTQEVCCEVCTKD